MKKAVCIIAIVLVIGISLFLITNNKDDEKPPKEESTIVCSEKDKC